MDLLQTQSENLQQLIEPVPLYSLPIILIVLYLLRQFFKGGVFTPPKGLSLSGKFAIVTGGNSGIGAQTARQLAALGCNVIIAGRDRTTAEKVLKWIRQEQPQAKVDFVSLDLASRESIEQFVKSVVFQRIDYLVNNAGMMALPQKRLTKEGFEMQWGVNHMGHFLLTYLLWPKISKSPNFRVINVSSLAHKRLIGFGTEPTLDFENINFQTNYDPNMSYSRSKLYNVLFTKALASRIGSRGLTMSLHPGVVRTQLLRQMTTGIKGGIIKVGLTLVYPIYMFFTKSCLQGSYTTMYTLLSEQVQNGEYYADCKKDGLSSLVVQENWERLWRVSEEKWGIKFTP